MLTYNYAPSIYDIENAIRSHNHAELVVLLESNIDLNQALSDGLCLLHIAVATNNLFALQALINKQADINIRDHKHGNTPLNYSSGINNLAAMNMLLQFGADINLANKYGETALSIALSLSYLDACKILIAAGANPTIKNIFERSALLLAIFRDQKEVIPDFYYKIENMNPREIYQRRRLSISFGDCELNHYLTEIDHFDYDKCSGGYMFEAAKILAPNLNDFILKHSLDFTDFYRLLIDINDSSQPVPSTHFNNRCLIECGSRSHAIYSYITQTMPDTFNLIIADRGGFALISDGVKVNPILYMNNIPISLYNNVVTKLKKTQSMDSKKALEFFYFKLPRLTNCHYEVVDSFEKPFKGGYCYYGNLKTLLRHKFLTTFGVKQGTILYKEFDISIMINERNNYAAMLSEPEQDPIIIHCDKLITKKITQLEKIKKENHFPNKISSTFLINKVNSLNDTGDSSLHVDAYFGKRDIAEILLKYGADSNIQNKSGMTPLHMAVLEESYDTVQMLLQYGANPNIQDELGQTPLICAIYSKNVPLIRLLLKFGAYAYPKTSAKPYTPAWIDASNGMNAYLNYVANTTNLDNVQNVLCLIKNNLWDSDELTISLNNPEKIHLFLEALNQNKYIKKITISSPSLTSETLSLILKMCELKKVTHLTLETSALSNLDFKQFGSSGLQSFIVNGVQQKRAANIGYNMGFFAPPEDKATTNAAHSRSSKLMLSS